MGIFDQLSDDMIWNDFLFYKLSKGNLEKHEERDLMKFVTNREYLQIVNKIIAKEPFPIPIIKEINKNGVNKKRSVFSFRREYNYVLKYLAYLLQSYDYLFEKNLYSFRNNTGVRKALFRVTRYTDISRVYTYKVDIHDYFNSINTEILIQKMNSTMPAEKDLIDFLASILRNPYAIKDGQIIETKKGAMAGVPFSGFLANLYLCELDQWFANRRILYVRYSDDIIVFSNSIEQINEYKTIIRQFFDCLHLQINDKKEFQTYPGDNIEFLGLTLSPDSVDVSPMSEKKLKGKLKRKARALYRWRIKKQLDGDKAAKAFIKFTNRKFYSDMLQGEITWCRWYFPVITTDKTLKRIDDYSISCIRYLYSGKYGKQNFNVRYESIVNLGYRSLVNNYWKFRRGEYSKENINI